MNIDFKLFSVLILLANTIGFAQNRLYHTVEKGESISEIAEKYNLKLDAFKKDANDRLYFVYTKL